MTATVRIPSQLRSLASGRREVRVEGTTVAEVLVALDSECPGFRERLFDDDGNIRRFINIFVEDEDLRFLDGLATRLEGDTSISIIPAVAGG